MTRRRLLIWGIPALLYAIFLGWYMDFGGPLSPSEVEVYLDEFRALGAPEEGLERIRIFMETDSGRPFVMVNVIDFADDPPDVEGAEPGESSEQLMGRYMEHMFPELLMRASHPSFMGEAFYPAIDLVGTEGLKAPSEWDAGALMRYRSRRTFMEVVTNPETLGRHEFKVAALDKTIAFPVETRLNPGDPRILLGLILLSAAALSDLIWGRRGTEVDGGV